MVGEDDSTSYAALPVTGEKFTGTDADAHADADADADGKSLQEDDRSHLTTFPQALLNSLKCDVGVGILSAPYALRECGLYAGIILIVVICVGTNYCCQLLTECRVHMQERLGHRGIVTYSQLAERSLGWRGRAATDASLVVAMYGCCVAYVVFVSQNLSNPRVFPGSLSQNMWILLQVPVYIALCVKNDLRFLAPVSLLGMIFLFTACGVVFYYGDIHIEVLPAGDYDFVRIKTLPIFLGAAAFSSEGIAAMTLPIEQTMLNPRLFPVIRVVTIGFISSLYISFGIVGYLLYYPDICDTITKNLPVSNLNKVLTVCLCLQLVFTYPQVIYVSFQVMETRLFGETAGSAQEQETASLLPQAKQEPDPLFTPTAAVTKLHHFAGSSPSPWSRGGYAGVDSPQPKAHTGVARTPSDSSGVFWTLERRVQCFRVGMVCLSAVLALGIPHFGLFLSLIGALSNGPVIFVFPPAFQLMLGMADHSPVKKVTLWLILVAGVLLTVSGTGVAVQNMIQSPQVPPGCSVT